MQDDEFDGEDDDDEGIEDEGDSEDDVATLRKMMPEDDIGATGGSSRPIR